MHPEDWLQVKLQLTDCLANPQPSYEVEFRLRHQNSSRRWILARAELVRDEHGVPVCMVGTGCGMDPATLAGFLNRSSPLSDPVRAPA